MLLLSRTTRRWIQTVIEIAQTTLLSTVTAIVLFRLGNMQLEGLLPFGGAVLGLLFGFTSLTFNRARAYSAGSTQRRSLMAAELSLRATLSYTLGAILAAFIFFTLASLGYKATPLDNWPTQAVPTMFAFVPLLFFTYTVVILSQATRVLLHGMLSPLSARRMAKNL